MKPVRIIPFIALAFLFLAGLACTSEYEAKRQQATEDAIGDLETATAFQATIESLRLTGTPPPPVVLTPTPTRSCLWTTDYFGIEICIDPENSGSQGTLSDTLTTKGDGESGWLWYYDSEGNKLGQLASGLSLKYTRVSGQGDFLVQLEGWVPRGDLTLAADGATGTISCNFSGNHSWGHKGDRDLCHSHFWNGAVGVIGTIPPNIEFGVSGTFSSRTILDAYGFQIETEGAEIRLEQLVRLKPENVQ